MPSNPVRVWAASATALLLWGCAPAPTAVPGVVECTSPPMAPAGQPQGMTVKPVPLDAVRFASADLARAMAVRSLHAARTPTDTVRVQARFVSCVDTPIVVRMRTSFLRPDAAAAESPSAWQYVFLPARAAALYEESSVSRDAASYLIEVGP